MIKISERAWETSGILWWTAKLLGMSAVASVIKSQADQRLIDDVRIAEKEGRLQRSLKGGKWVWTWSEQIEMRMRGERDPEVCWNENWDGSWRLFTFDLPAERTKTRRRLLRTLTALGFGKLQQSVWICPRRLPALVSLLDSIDIDASELSVFEAKTLLGRDASGIAQDAWPWDRIAESYDHYEERLENMRNNLPQKLTLGAAGTWIKAEAEIWLEACQADPFLPRPFDPEGNIGPGVWKRRQTFILDVLNRSPLRK